MLKLIEKQLFLDETNQDFEAINQRVFEDYAKHALAVIMYGSCLSKTTKKPDSVPDYFIVVDSFKDYYRSKKLRVLNQILSPNIFHFEIEQGFSKYSVVSIAQLEQETSIYAKDMYFLGRFSKSVFIYWCKDDLIKKRIVQIQAQACNNVAKIVLSSLNIGDSLSFEDFVLHCIGLSYAGDVRVEASDKVEKLFLAQKEFYYAVYAKVLENLHDKKIIYFDDNNLTLLDKRLLPKHYQALILRSKLRAQLRWPKAMFTAKNWLDYVLLKIKRNYGDEFTLKEKEKKYWYFYGWKLLFKLNRKKMLK